MTRQDILNEVRAIDKLCNLDTHRNIVQVFRQGPLQSSPYYFFDMEYCPINLEKRIKDSESLLKPLSTGNGNQDFDTTFKSMFKVMRIVADITKGLAFIHSKGEVHRDLKPQKGITTLSFADSKSFSPTKISAGRLPISASLRRLLRSGSILQGIRRGQIAIEVRKYSLSRNITTKRTFGGLDVLCSNCLQGQECLSMILRSFST